MKVEVRYNRSKSDGRLFVDNKLIPTEADVWVAEYFEPQKLILVLSSMTHLDPNDPETAQNVWAYDLSGKLIWRIQPAISGSPVAWVPYNRFMSKILDNEGRVGTINGYSYKLDFETGEVSEPCFTG